MKTNHAVLLFIIIVCLFTVTAYHVGYCQGYDKGKEDWFSIGEIAGRTNQLADELYSDDYYMSIAKSIYYNESNYAVYNWSNTDNTTSLFSYNFSFDTNISEVKT